MVSFSRAMGDKGRRENLEMPSHLSLMTKAGNILTKGDHWFCENCSGENDRGILCNNRKSLNKPKWGLVVSQPLC